MIIDKEPLADKINRTLTVSTLINTTEEVSIALNGAVAIHLDDVESISGNVITLVPGLDIDWGRDSFVVFYERI